VSARRSNGRDTISRRAASLVFGARRLRGAIAAALVVQVGFRAVMLMELCLAVWVLARPNLSRLDCVRPGPHTGAEALSGLPQAIPLPCRRLF
jgi:hypothetical protein